MRKPFGTLLFTALTTIILAAILCGNVGAAEDSAEPTVSLPAEYAAKYVVASDTISPDEKFAVIVPNDDPEAMSPAGKNYLVALEPFSILGVLETDSPYFEGQSHGAIAAEWSEDSSVALLTLAGKWGPRHLFLVELRGGTLSRTTDLLVELYNLLRPNFRKAKPKPEPYNDEVDFIFVGEDPVGTLQGRKRVRIVANAASDPKGGHKHRWKAHVVATWDIAGRNFTEQKITHPRQR